jgi:hypothetical protein
LVIDITSLSDNVDNPSVNFVVDYDEKVVRDDKRKDSSYKGLTVEKALEAIVNAVFDDAGYGTSFSYMDKNEINKYINSVNKTNGTLLTSEDDKRKKLEKTRKRKL